MDLSLLSENAKKDFELLSYGDPLITEVCQITRSGSLDIKCYFYSKFYSMLHKHNLLLFETQKQKFEIVLYDTVFKSKIKVLYTYQAKPSDMLKEVEKLAASHCSSMRINCFKKEKHKFGTCTKTYSFYILIE